MTKKGGKVRDKWKDKEWVIVKAPLAFGYQPVAYIPITDEDNAIGRTIEVTLFDIWKSDPLQHTIKLYFQIEKIEDGYAYTRFKGHEYAREYIRSLIRRGSSQVTYIHDFNTKDNYKFRITTMVFTQKRINTAKKWLVRQNIQQVLEGEMKKLTLDQFIQSVVGPKINADLLRRTKSVIGIRHITVVKSKLLATPEERIEYAIQR